MIRLSTRPLCGLSLWPPNRYLTNRELTKEKTNDAQTHHHLYHAYVGLGISVMVCIVIRKFMLSTFCFLFSFLSETVNYRCKFGVCIVA